jgi:hypothetical protein
MRCATILILVLVTGCGDRGDSNLDEVEKHLQSWSATLEMTSQLYANGAVTRAYARQIAKAAGEDLSDQQKSLAESPDQNKRRQLQSRFGPLNEQVHSLAAMAEAGSER